MPAGPRSTSPGPAGGCCGSGTRRAPTSDGARRRHRTARRPPGPVSSPDPVDRLALDVLVHARLAPLTPDARVTEATERGQGVGCVAVEAERPGAHASGHGQAPGLVGR